MIQGILEGKKKDAHWGEGIHRQWTSLSKPGIVPGLNSVLVTSAGSIQLCTKLGAQSSHKCRGVKIIYFMPGISDSYSLNLMSPPVAIYELLPSTLEVLLVVPMVQAPKRHFVVQSRFEFLFPVEYCWPLWSSDAFARADCLASLDSCQLIPYLLVHPPNSWASPFCPFEEILLDFSRA
jgi:hypothetical protein